MDGRLVGGARRKAQVPRVPKYDKQHPKPKWPDSDGDIRDRDPNWDEI